jgi:hypothetical protein
MVRAEIVSGGAASLSTVVWETDRASWAHVYGGGHGRALARPWFSVRS